MYSNQAFKLPPRHAVGVEWAAHTKSDSLILLFIFTLTLLQWLDFIAAETARWSAQIEISAPFNVPKVYKGKTFLYKIYKGMC